MKVLNWKLIASMLAMALVFSTVLWAQAPRPFFVDSTGIVNALGLRGTCAVPPCEITDFDVAGAITVGVNQVLFGSGAGAITSDTNLEYDGTNFQINSPASVSGALSGDPVLALNSTLRGANTAGTGTVPLLRSTTIGGLDVAQFGRSSNFMAIGSPTTVGGSSVGEVTLANSRAIRSSNSAGTGSLSLLALTGVTDVLVLGANGNVIIGIGGPASTAGASNGEIVIQNGLSIRAADNAATGTIPLIASDASDNFLINPSTGTLQVVTRDAVDSCGVGFRCLRVPN